LLFGSGDAAVALGVARSCLTAFVELASTKTPRAMQATLRDQPMIQAAVGQSEANLRSGKAFLTEAVRDLWTEATSTGATSQEQRAVLRLAVMHSIRLAVQIVDTLYNAAGVTAIYEGNPIQRHFQDIHVISQHLQARLSYYELVGQHWLGLKIDLTRP
jgi:alkylation response protein AidB-like acyl-CoA dehydrogenase